MKHLSRITFLCLVLAITAMPISATQVRNICTLKGTEQNTLTGYGLVVGLNGTGDKEFGPAHKATLESIKKYFDATAIPVDLRDAQNIALVSIVATVPAEGVRSGVDLLDVQVSAIGAESLKGGTLLPGALMGPPGLDGKASLFAMASGKMRLDDEDNPTSAKIVNGAQMVRDIPSQNLDKFGRITLVLHKSKASWALANFIAEAINGVMVLEDDGAPIAKAVDQKNVIIQVPKEALPNLSGFITQVMMTTIDSEIASGGARVIINKSEGTIVMTKDVELSPVIISHKGMTIQIVTPQPEPDIVNPKVENNTFVPMDPENRGGPRLRQLLDSLNTLNVPIDDRIAIIKQIHDLGVLHAKLEYK